MKLKFLGTGGAIRIPRACCNCKICTESRIKGFPYKRLGQSLFIEDENILFDTPEDINEELNVHRINEVKHIFYSHWHPDHTLGCRIIEILNKNRLKDPIKIYMPEENIDHFLNKKDPIFKYYEGLGFCNIKKSNSPQILNSIKITRVQLSNEFSYAFLIEESEKKILYCPCHSNCIKELDTINNLDLLIINLGHFEYNTSAFTTSFYKDNLKTIKLLQPKKTIFTHIEEDYKLSYDDFKIIESEYTDIIFAFDGMEYYI